MKLDLLKHIKRAATSAQGFQERMISVKSTAIGNLNIDTDLPAEWTCGGCTLKHANKTNTIGQFMAIWRKYPDWTRQLTIIDQS